MNDNPKARRHSVGTMSRARDLHAVGWDGASICRILSDELGVRISRNTVLRWCDEKYAAKDAERIRAAHRTRWASAWTFKLGGGRVSDEYRLAFMERLRHEGLSCASIGKVHGVVFGDALTHNQVRYALRAA